MKKNLKNKETENSKKKLKEILIPSIMDLKSSQIEILGNNEAIIEGCKGILEYEEDVIKLNLGKMSVKFCGKNLTVKCMNNDSVILSGFISNIEFNN